MRRDVLIDCNRASGPKPKCHRLSVGSGRAVLGLRSDWQRSLDLVHRECGFEYVRFHGLLNDEMGVAYIAPDGSVQFGWQYVNALFDAIREIGMRPFVEFSFMPSGLASGDKTIFWWRGNTTMPADLDRWGELIKAFTQHVTRRYGAAEVARWYFEVWNEPNLPNFFAGTREEYFLLYRTAALAIKSVSERYRVGGPATAEHAWIPEFTQFCAESHTPVDFVSSHGYGVRGALDADGKRQLYLDPDPDSFTSGVRSVRQQVAASPFPGLEIHYTEWSSSYSPHDPIHDSYIQAPYLLTKMKQCEPYVDSLSYWTFSDIFEEHGPPRTPFHGGFGLLNFQGLRKPSHYAYMFHHMLGETLLEVSDPHAWASSGTDQYQALIWDWTPTPADQPNGAFFARDVPAESKEPCSVFWKNVFPGSYRVSTFRVGYRAHDAYTAYLDLGAPNVLTPEDEALLRKEALLQPEEVVLRHVDGSGRLELPINLRSHDVVFVELKRR